MRKEVLTLKQAKQIVEFMKLNKLEDINISFSYNGIGTNIVISNRFPLNKIIVKDITDVSNW